MPKYRFEGAEWNIGGRVIEYGEEVELPAAPNRMFVEVKLPLPKRKIAKVTQVTKENTDG